MKRPKDIIDHVEEMAASSGNFGSVDEAYFRGFFELTQPQIEKLAIAVMLDQEKEIRRLATKLSETDSVERIAKLVRNVFTAISIGLARFDAFGRIGFVARVGFEPSLEQAEAMRAKFALIEPIIKNMVRCTLPWLLSLEVSQNQLPL